MAFRERTHFAMRRQPNDKHQAVLTRIELFLSIIDDPVLKPRLGWRRRHATIISAFEAYVAITFFAQSTSSSRFAGIWSNFMIDQLDADTSTSEDAAVSRQTILERLSAEAPGLRKRYGVKSLAIFGSMARGDDHEGSDVDMLVTFESEPTFDNFMGLKLDLEDLLGLHVDLGTPDTLRPEMRAEVERNLINVP